MATEEDNKALETQESDADKSKSISFDREKPKQTAEIPISKEEINSLVQKEIKKQLDDQKKKLDKEQKPQSPERKETGSILPKKNKKSSPTKKTQSGKDLTTFYTELQPIKQR